MKALLVREKNWEQYLELLGINPSGRNYDEYEEPIQYWYCDQSEDALRIDLLNISKTKLKKLKDMAGVSLSGYTYLILWK